MKQVTHAEYTKIHVWLNETFGKAVACENPKCEKKSTIFEYALRAGKTHKKLRANYMTLCHKCHTNYDNQHKNHHHVSNVPVRLSMKLLYKLYQPYHKTLKKIDDCEVNTFLLYVEQQLKQ